MKTSFARQMVMDGGISIQLRTNLFLGSREMGERLLHYLVQREGVFTPEVFDGGAVTAHKKVKFDPDDLGLPLKAWTHDRYSLGILAERRHPIKVQVSVSSTEFTMFDHVGLTVCLDRNGSLDPKRVNWFVENVSAKGMLQVGKGLYDLVQPNWGYIKNDFYEHLIGDVLDEHGNVIESNPPKGPARSALRGLFWANLFGPEYVDMFGREKLSSAPVHRVEPLPDGGLALYLSESPFDASKPEYQTQKNQLFNYLSEDAFSGKLLPSFRMGPGRKVKNARPLVETKGLRDDIFWHESQK